MTQYVALAILFLLSAVAAPSAAQSTPDPVTPAAKQPALGTIRGTVYDSLSGRAMADATVELASPARVVLTDRRGNFAIDSVPVGPHRLTFSSPDLDSIGLFGFARELDVRVGVQRVTLATPSFGTLYGRLCAPTDVVARDSAIMFGTVYDARTGQPAKAVTVSFRWFAVDSTASQLIELTRQTTTDDNGNYGRCGLPSDLALQTQAGTVAAASGTVSGVVGSARVLRRDFFISDEFSADTASGAPDGTGVVRGTVRDERQGPLVNALVVLLASDRTTRTDSTGQFRFVNVPLGTQELSVRQVGHGAVFRSIDVTGRAPIDLSIMLPSATVLAAMNVRATRRLGSDQADFLARKRIGQGRYLDQAEIARRFDTAAALQRIPGLRVLRSFGGLNIMNQRTGCEPLIVIDGVPNSMRNAGSTIPLPGAAARPRHRSRRCASRR